MKYLITGGAGFIGSNLVEKVLELGHEVRVLDNFSTGRRENLEPFKTGIELIEGDIRDYPTVVSAVDSVDYVLHQAALPSVPRSIDDPRTSNDVNINGTLNLLEASRHAGVKRFVMASSSAVYGESEELPKVEHLTPSPLSPYAISKITNEYYCHNYWHLYGLPTVCLRYFNVFGPRQDPTSEYSAVIPLFITALKAGRTPTVYGDGEQSRDFIYIENVVQANLLAIETDGMAGEALNCACGEKITLNQLLDELRDIMDLDIKAKYAEARAGDIRHSYANIDRLKKYGYQPAVDFREGLKRTIAAFT